MLKTIVIKDLNFKRNGTKKITVSQRIKKGEKILGIFIIAIILSTSLIYIFQMSSIATNGYEIEKYENRLTDLKKENQEMTIEIADLKAMHNLENNNNEFVTVEYSNIAYIVSSSGAVAIQK